MRNRLYRFGKFQLETSSRELRRDGEHVQVARRAFDCLLYLLEHRERAVGRDELTAAVWGRVDVTDAQLSQVMLQARRAIDDSGQAQLAIRTLPGFGYRWIADVEEGAGDSVAPRTPAAPSRGADAPAGAEAAAPSAAAGRIAPGTSARAFRRAATVAAVFLLALAAVALPGVRDRGTVPPPAPAVPSSATAVLPLEVDGPGDSGWIRLGAMDLIAERLRNAGLAVPPSENVLAALRDAPAAQGSSRRGGNLGVGTLIEGRAVQSPEGWTVELLARRGESQRHTASATHADVIRAARQAADLLLAAMGRTPPPERGEDDDLAERLQQAQAAILAGELDTARAILTGLPEQDEPGVRLMLALVDLRSGRLERALAGYTELIASPAAGADPLLRGRALSHRALVRVRLEDYAAAERDYDEAVALLRDTGSAIDLARALNGRGGVRVGLERFDEAAADLGRARIELQRSGDRLGLIQSDANFGLLEYGRNRFEQALPYLLGAANQFEAFGAPERVLGVLTAAYDAQVALLRWPEALAITDRQWTHRDRAGDPGLLLQITVNRAEALAMLGRLREARELAAQAEREHGTTRAQARRHLQALLAKIAWLQGDGEGAVAAADRALALWAPDDPDDNRYGAQLLLLRQRALIATGQAGPEALEREPVSGEAKPSVFRLIARAERAAWSNRAPDAEKRFREALDEAEASGVPIGLAAAGEAYGRWLLGQGRVEEASALAGRLTPWADRDFDVALFRTAVFDARGDRREADLALQQARALAGERRLPPGTPAVAAQ